MSADEHLSPQQFPQAPEGVTKYRSGGIGHRRGDPERSVVGMVPTHVHARYREHGGDWNGEVSDKTASAIRETFRAGAGTPEPLMLIHDQRQQWASLGEYNHRLHAA